MNRYEHLRTEAAIVAGGSMWGEPTEAQHLGNVAAAAIAPVYEEVLEARDEDIRFLRGQVAELQDKLYRIRREASA